MLEWISQPWSWYVAGPMLSVLMIAMLYFGERFGISKSFEVACRIGGANKLSDFFDWDWRKYDWLIVFVVGAMGGGWLASNFLGSSEGIELNPVTVASLETYGFTMVGERYLPHEIFSWANLMSVPSMIMIVLGGFLVGFGTRYAGGCTSGHTISGISELQVPSMIATFGFFIGGLITTHFILPFLLELL